MNGPLLELDRVEAAYGPFRALFGVSFTVQPGEAVALLGSNGAGKTTVARVCSGLLHPSAGTIRFEGEDVSSSKAFKLARRGISHAPEGRSVFASLTVEENLELAFHQAFGRRGARAAVEEAYELFPRLGERAAQHAGSLSGGEQRMLALARVLVNPPRLLIVDELSLGLAPIIVNEVYQQLARLKGKGITLLVVEQHVEHALALADRVVVLSRGEVSYQGPVIPIEELAPFFLPRQREAAEDQVGPERGDGR
ncbi:ABC transporter ATP-binding protein [Rhabdothermincola sediminis]|uniref:ABC transporter ATP-binding protein n=1 Tax=Rhabdothermincola sediminis TaxID=2751370 RepID=UPI001AA02A7E|nr:ABC transporter ATP-binding protein [Rhabdothermincola sediminis]